MMAIVTAVVMALVPVFGYVGVRAVLDSTGGKNALADNLPTQSFPATPTGLLMTVDDNGVLAGLTVFVLGSAGVGGSIVPISVNADVGFTDDGRRSIQQVYADEGPEATVFAAESVLLVSINFWEVADPAATGGILLPFEPYEVALVHDVEVAQGEVILAGTSVLDARSAASVLTAGAGLGNESERASNAEALWSSFGVKVGAGRPLPDPAAGAPTDFAGLLARVEAGTVASRGVGVTGLTAEENPTGLDVVQINQSEALFVFASVCPAQVSAPRPGLLMRVVAPPGYEAEVLRTIDVILYVGANVVSVALDGVAQPGTTFLVADEANRDRLAVTDGIFGNITIEQPDVRIDGVDVTIVLGTDYLESVEL
jgi:hypothetical protein